MFESHTRLETILFDIVIMRTGTVQTGSQYTPLKSLTASGFCLHFEQKIFIKYEVSSKYLAFFKLTNTFI